MTHDTYVATTLAIEEMVAIDDMHSDNLPIAKEVRLFVLIKSVTDTQRGVTEPEEPVNDNELSKKRLILEI